MSGALQLEQVQLQPLAEGEVQAEVQAGGVLPGNRATLTLDLMGVMTTARMTAMQTMRGTRT